MPAPASRIAWASWRRPSRWAAPRHLRKSPRPSCSCSRTPPPTSPAPYCGSLVGARLGGAMAKAQHMGLSALAVGVLCTAAIPIGATGAETVAKPQPLKCDIGPVTRTYGATQWQVYSCADQRSVVILSAPGSPAAPFYFMFSPGTDGYRLYGEGTGSKDA